MGIEQIAREVYSVGPRFRRLQSILRGCPKIKAGIVSRLDHLGLWIVDLQALASRYGLHITGTAGLNFHQHLLKVLG